jgi:DNA-directed RNA polymerase subunit M/transcription elongation factor TFIIS
MAGALERKAFDVCTETQKRGGGARRGGGGGGAKNSVLLPPSPFDAGYHEIMWSMTHLLSQPERLETFISKGEDFGKELINAMWKSAHADTPERRRAAETRVDHMARKIKADDPRRTFEKRSVERYGEKNTHPPVIASRIVCPKCKGNFAKLMRSSSAREDNNNNQFYQCLATLCGHKFTA